MPQTVTAVITTYHRRAELLERAIKSVLAQTYPDIELIVVDDNENDSPYCGEISSLCGRTGARYIKQNGNQGACAARNLGIQYASGEYIGFLDDDDEWMPEKIEKQVARFQSGNDRLGMVYCRGLIIDEETSLSQDYYSIMSPLNLTFDMMLAKDYIGTTTNPLIRKECFDRVGGFWTKQPARQDYEMWIRIAREYEIVGLEGPLFKNYHHAGDQITKQPIRAFIGMRNIYWRYKKEYYRLPFAERRQLDLLIRAGKQCGKKCLYYRLRRKFLIRKHHMKP